MARLKGIPKVGDGITVHLWSDSLACTVIDTRGTTSFTARRDKATRTNREADKFSPGGFFGHTSHTETPTWAYEADPNGSIFTVTRRKDGSFRPAGSGTNPVSEGRHERYDYNF